MKELKIMRSWIESEITFYQMLRDMSPAEKRREFTARIAQCKDSILKIDEITATFQGEN